MIAARIVEDCERRAQESERLREELIRAQLAERAAKDKLQELLQASSSSYSTAAMVGVSARAKQQLIELFRGIAFHVSGTLTLDRNTIKVLGGSLVANERVSE